MCVQRCEDPLFGAKYLSIDLKLRTENIEVSMNWVDWFDGEKAYKCVDSLSCLGKISEVF